MADFLHLHYLKLIMNVINFKDNAKNIFKKPLDKIKIIVYNKNDESGALLSLVWLTL